MQRLRTVIRKYLAPTMGGGPPMDALAAELKAISRSDETYFRIAVAMLIALFLAALSLVIARREHPGDLAAILAACGASVLGVVRMMSNLWREKVATDVALAMAAYLPEDESKVVLQVFLDRITAPKPRVGAGSTRSSVATAPGGAPETS